MKCLFNVSLFLFLRAISAKVKITVDPVKKSSIMLLFNVFQDSKILGGFNFFTRLSR